jgi:UDP-N-acetylglucosamine--N-acetylmuramyl-(pentapeptide) pyrophosphoryl-undecaprenol N-acetylglucosamine transferase
LAEISALGIPSILIPYPYHKDEHQLINANILGTVGGAKVVPDCCDVEKTATHLGQELKILMADDTLRNEMSRNCLDLAKTNGATLVAEALIALANEGWTEI